MIPIVSRKSSTGIPLSAGAWMFLKTWSDKSGFSCVAGWANANQAPVIPTTAMPGAANSPRLYHNLMFCLPRDISFLSPFSEWKVDVCIIAVDFRRETVSLNRPTDRSSSDHFFSSSPNLTVPGKRLGAGISTLMPRTAGTRVLFAATRTIIHRQ